MLFMGHVPNPQPEVNRERDQSSTPDPS